MQWMRSLRQAEQRQLISSLQASIALILASLLILVTAFRDHIEFAYWAPLTVAFVSGDNIGASFHTSVLRLQGTVAGAVFSYICFQELQSSSLAMGALFTLWITISTYVRTSQGIEYAGTVAGFAAAIVLQGSIEAEPELAGDVAFSNILNTCYGIVIYLLVANLFFPQRASWLVQQRAVHCVTLALAVVTELLPAVVKQLDRDSDECVSKEASESDDDDEGSSDMEAALGAPEAAGLHLRGLEASIEMLRSELVPLPSLIEQAKREPALIGSLPRGEG
jgi:uncharacterized membrane protein YccC